MDDSPYSIVRAEVLASLMKALGTLNLSDDALSSTLQPSMQKGDLSCSIAFRFSKTEKKNPREIAEAIVRAIEPAKSIAKVTADNGYINFHFEKSQFAKATVSYASGIAEGATVSDFGRGLRATVEYPSVNPAHPMHVGQVRSALLGDSISNIHAACGYAVEREDYIDDLGLQAAQALWGAMNKGRIGLAEEVGKKFDHSLGDAYVAANKYLAEHKEAEEEIKKLMTVMDQDGTYESKLSRAQAEAFVKAERDTLFAYRIYHDVLVWESDVIHEKLLDKAIQLLDRQKLLERPTGGKYSGCVIISLAKLKDLPKEFQGLREEAKVLIRSSGAPNYLAKDIAFHMWKFGLLPDTFKYSQFMERQPNGRPLYTTGRSGTAMDFGNAKKVINVIDYRQSAEQLMIKVVLEAMGMLEAAQGFNHLSYGVVELENAILAGRKGTWIGFTADDLIREATEKAITLISERFKDEKRNRAEIASAVALGAIKFEFLKYSPEKNITFSWKNALNFEGNSGPYCQYMHARAMRMIEDSGFVPDRVTADPALLITKHEFALIKKISMVKEITEKACTELRTNVVAEYAIELAALFSKFYENVPVLKAESDGEREARLALTFAFARTMKYTLALLGIPSPDRM